MLTNKNLNNKIEKDLNLHFKIKSLKQSNLLLGIKIHVGVKTIKISQSHYDFLLNRYGLTDANPVSTPMDPNVKLDIDTKNDEKEGEGKKNLKKIMVITVNWIANVSYISNISQHILCY